MSTPSSRPSITASMQPPVVMAIAGTDTSGAAGLAADLKTFSAHGVHGVFAVSVLTAQNSTGIREVRVLDDSFVAAQIDTVTDDVTVQATKTGLLYSEAAVEAVAGRVGKLGALVVDPVLVRATGEPFVDAAVVDRYRTRLAPIASVITPNVAEAALLTDASIDSVETARSAAEHLLGWGCGAVVVTGIVTGDVVSDVVATPDETFVLDKARVDTPNLLGTGCSFAAAIAARLGRGDDLVDAVVGAHHYVDDGLRSAATWRLGAGRGPIDHIATWRSGELP